MRKTEDQKPQDSNGRISPETEARRRIARNPLRLYFYYLIPLIVLAVIIYYAFGAN